MSHQLAIAWLRVIRCRCTVLTYSVLCLAAKVLELYPFLEETGVIDEILPKKEQAALAKLYVQT